MPVRVHKLRTKPGGGIEILLQGTPSDADYVRRILDAQMGIQTTEPKQSPAAPGISMTFTAKGTPANPLTREKVLDVLKKDKYVELMPHAG